MYLTKPSTIFKDFIEGLPSSFSASPALKNFLMLRPPLRYLLIKRASPSASKSFNTVFPNRNGRSAAWSLRRRAETTRLPAPRP